MFFHKNLNYLTKNTPINQNQLATKMNINRQNITKWLDKSEPGYSKLIEISKIYNISIDDLLTKDLEESSK